MLTVWLPVVVTILVAVLLRRRPPATTAQALRALGEVVGPAPQVSHVRVLHDEQLAEVIPLRRRSAA